MTFYDIDVSAPVSANADILIDAPAHAVWARLSHVSGWPEWNTGVQWISAQVPLTTGTGFEMRSAGQTVRGRIQAVRPEDMLCWSSSALFISARHLVTLEDLGTQTRVHVSAAYRGAWPVAMPKRARRHLKAMIQTGLEDLRNAVERRPVKRKAA